MRVRERVSEYSGEITIFVTGWGDPSGFTCNGSDRKRSGLSVCPEHTQNLAYLNSQSPRARPVLEAPTGEIFRPLICSRYSYHQRRNGTGKAAYVKKKFFSCYTIYTIYEKTTSNKLNSNKIQPCSKIRYLHASYTVRGRTGKERSDQKAAPFPYIVAVSVRRNSSVSVCISLSAFAERLPRQVNSQVIRRDAPSVLWDSMRIVADCSALSYRLRVPYCQLINSCRASAMSGHSFPALSHTSTTVAEPPSGPILYSTKAI